MTVQGRVTGSYWFAHSPIVLFFLSLYLWHFFPTAYSSTLKMETEGATKTLVPMNVYQTTTRRHPRIP
jgi:hypothetical protein